MVLLLNRLRLMAAATSLDPQLSSTNTCVVSRATLIPSFDRHRLSSIVFAFDKSPRWVAE
jgi:hypothetical protein